MISELYTSVASCFAIKGDHKKYVFVLVLHLFRDVSFFMLGRGDTARLLRGDFIYGQGG